MVPMDQPAAALQMISRWTQNQDLVTGQKLPAPSKDTGCGRRDAVARPRMVTREGGKSWAQE